MWRYAIKLTIAGLTGVYADKYSYTVREAQHLDALLQASTASSSHGPLDVLEAREEPAEFDGFELLPRIMKQLRRVALEDADRMFYTGVRFEPVDGEPGAWHATLSGRDDDGPFEIRGHGRKPVLVRLTSAEAGPASDGESEATDLRAHDDGSGWIEWPAHGGSYVVRGDRRKALFKEQLEQIIHMCEEALAKNQPLIATTLGADETDDAAASEAAPFSVEL